MAEEPTSTDLLDAIRAALDALNAGDLDAAVAIYSKDAVFDRSVGGMEVLEGREAIRGFAADWTGAYEDYEQELVEFRDLGHGVTFGVAHQRGRLKGSGGLLQLRFAAVTEWVNGKIERQTSYLDIDEARAAAERLAEERGQTVSEEESTTPDLVELGREAFEALNRRDLDAVMDLYAPDAVWVATALGVNFEGVAAIRRFYEEFIEAFDDHRFEIDQLVDVGSGVGFAVVCHHGHPVGGTGYVQMREAIVTVWVNELMVWGAGYLDPDEARAAAERLAQERG